MGQITPIKPLHLDDVAECSPKAKQQLRDLRTALEQAERQRDEARGLLRRCREQIDTEGGADELVDEINARLRDTGE